MIILNYLIIISNHKNYDNISKNKNKNKMDNVDEFLQILN